MNRKSLAHAALFLGVAQLVAIPALAAQIEAAFMTATRYNIAGQVTGTIAPDPDGGGSLRLLATRNTYDSTGLLIKSEVGQLTSFPDETVSTALWANYGFSGINIFSTQEFSYDSYGNRTVGLTRGRDGAPEGLVQYSYDENNFVRCKAVRMNKNAFTPPYPDPCQLGSTGADGPDRITRYTTTVRGHVTTEERAIGTALEQTYVTNVWLLDTLLSQTDANGNKSDLRPDSYGRLKRRVYPSPSSPGSLNEGDYEEYGYDANGNVTSERKRSGATIAYTYDANNRPTLKDLSSNAYGEDTQYDYDARGLTLYSRFASSTAVGVFNQFDGFGRLHVSTTVAKVGTATQSRPLTSDYDNNGNRTRLGYPDGSFFVYGYDGMNRLNCVAESPLNGVCDPLSGSSRLVTVDYRTDGRRSRLLRPGAATTNYSFNNANRLDIFGQDFTGTADDLTNNFTYNAGGQITQLTFVNSLYAYVGNMNRTGSYSADGLNRYTINGAPQPYDANGNLASEGGNGLTYDMENRLVVTSGTTGSLKYDVVGRLAETSIVPSSTTQFLYDGDALVAEYSISGNTATQTRRYVHGNLGDEPWVQYEISGGTTTRRYLYADHQSSIVAFSDAAGVVTKKLAYDAFGIPKGTNQERFGYTGQTFLKELGLYYYKARIYSPKLGRFLQTDPIFYQDDMNLYAYSRHDPFNVVDPSGKCSGGAFVAAGFSSAADGPLPVGEIVGAGILAADCLYRLGRIAYAGAVAFGAWMAADELIHQNWVLPSDTMGTPPDPNDPFDWNKAPQTASTTVWRADSNAPKSIRGARVDFENPSPSTRPGQIHLQIGGNKWIYRGTGRWQGATNDTPMLTNSQLDALNKNVSLTKKLQKLEELILID